MRTPFLLSLLAWTAVSLFAADEASPTPSLRTLLTPAEWTRAGLDRLSADEIGVIDAALTRHEAQVRSTHVEPAPATPAAAAEKHGWLDRFSVGRSKEAEWRQVPPLRAQVVGWESANRFKLDNGQVWESRQPIPYELPGKTIEIRARPRDLFTLVVDGRDTALHVVRVR